MLEESAARRLHFACWVAAAFVLLTIPRLLAHELWRDEAWLWLVVTESHSLGDLVSPLARSGQGYLFPFLCFLAKGLGTSYRTMQLVNLALAGGGAFVFARWAPLGRRERALFVLGYFPFYEYAVLSRHYAAGALLLWLACAAARSRKPALGLGAAIGLLCQTTIYGFILAVAVAAGWLLDRLLRRREEALPPARELAAGAVLALAGAVAGIVQLIPAAGTSFSPGWRLDWQPAIAERVLQMPWRAFAPLPRIQLNFWNSNALDPWPAWQAAAGVLVLAGAIAWLWPRKVAVATFLIGALGLASFGYVKFVGALRHDGHWWLLFAAALWLGGGLAPAALQTSWRSTTLLVVLVVHCAVAVFASWMDLRHPFSNAARTAQRIQQRGLEAYPLFGYREPPAAPVALALGKPLYFPSRGVFTTYPDYGPQSRELSEPEVRCAARGLADREGNDVILVMNRELPPWGELEEVDAVVGAIQKTEDYHLYRLARQRLADSADEAACPPVQPSAPLRR